MRRSQVIRSVLLASAMLASGCSSSTERAVVPTTAAVAAATTTASPATAPPTTVAPTTTVSPTTAAPTTTALDTTAAPTTTVPPTTAPPTTAVPTTTTADVPGTLLSSQPVDIGDLGVAWRVVYRSTSVAGEPIEVTGIIAAPSGDADGPRPVLSVAHGTTGMADQCAPSLDFPDGVSLTFMAPFLERGWVVTATDYEGMGGPGIHPYIVGESEARGVFDIVRAAQTMPGVGADGPLVVWGHSQGGHAAMHVAERWQDLAPDLDLVGVAAGAPPSQFALLSAFLQGSAFQGYLVMAAASLAATYDELDLEAVMNPANLHLLDELEKGCTDHIFDVFNEIPYEELVSVDDIFAIPAWNARLMENDTNQLPNQVPVVILHGDQDEQIPVVSSAALFAQLCAFADHAPLERRVYEGEGHGSVVPAYLDDLTAWLEARVAGEPATDQCGT